MTIFEALVLGVLQGLAEFLPISSSAHLALAPWVFGWRDPGLAFDVALHVGTLVAVLWYFNQEWRTLSSAFLRLARTRRPETEEQRRIIYLVIATIPGAIAGLLVEDHAESTFRAPKLIATALMVMGVILWWVDRAAARDRSLATMRWSDALLIGVGQMFALLPGVSRSGSTITAGRALRFSRESAAVFSFLMSAPITFAAIVLKVPDAVRETGISAPLVVGVVASAVSGWVAISVLLKLVARHGYGAFAAYRLLLGAGILALAFARGG
ncbi:MAG: undecaprenyl-diphosphatase UppP [Gemmatimonadota bacterium]|nr:undecaprenyl-diphosphatase UppP [Gemmatimonadota bacterium]